jgi:predicted acetyltransferase
MTHIIPLPPEDIHAFVAIVALAYPGLKLVTTDDRQRMAERLLDRQMKESDTRLYGAYRDGRLVGGMRFHDFTMTLRGAHVPVGGVGLVAVDFAHKKQRIAKALIAFYLDHYREQGAPIAALYPFRPDFYGQMGFGYGPKINQYRVKPGALPRRDGRQHVRLLDPSDAPALHECYARYAAQTHGMMARTRVNIDNLLGNPDWHMAAYERDGTITGYVAWSFKPLRDDNFILNNMQIEELVYLDREALGGLIGFLRSQDDQINALVFNTLDPDFHHLLPDPRNGSQTMIPHVYHESNVQGVGLMYRVIDLPGVFRALADQPMADADYTLRLTLRDSFLPANDGSYLIGFRDRRPALLDGGPHDVAVEIDVAQCSSLLMGVVPFRRLHSYGLAEISDPSLIDTVDRTFRTPQPPICLSRF